MKNAIQFSALVLALPSITMMACAPSTQPYYAAEGKVNINSVTPQLEEGNVGGEVIVISGIGFGDDLNGVTVQIGNQNAHVQTVNNTSITAITPRGPIHGGAVDVAVGNADGQGRIVKGYTYAIPGNGLEAIGDDSLSSDTTASKQIAYIAISNDSLSCYGGLDYPIAAELGAGFCNEFAYTGSAGVEGRSEALEFVYPKSFTPYYLGKGGFASAHDISWEKWSIFSPPQDVISFDDENNIEDMRLDVGAVTLTNSNISSDTWCGDLNGFANFIYNGDDVLDETQGWKYPSSSISIDNNFDVSYGEGSSCYPGALPYKTNELNFCMVEEYEVGQTNLYEADRPIQPNFFRGPGDGGVPDPTMPVTVQLTAEKAGIVNQEITFPPYLLANELGAIELEPALETIDNGGTAWSLFGIPECPDSTGDRQTFPEDAVYRWTWEPVVWDCDSDNPKAVCLDNDVKAATTYVKVTVSYFAFSWLGGDGLPIRATITVPDDHNYDPETGVSTVELPAWVMYSFPSAKYDFGYTAGGGVGEPDRWTGYASSDRQDYGYVTIALDRITEYTLDASFDTTIGTDDVTVNGDLVVAYSTGDLALFLFDNPLENVDSNQCGDCIDSDGDGWVDLLDVDCILDPEGGEQGPNPDYGCSDGLDNDGDGFIDADDPECVDGASNETIDCSDGIDNDADGWIDSDDPDCGTDATEIGLTDSTCNDGIDNDADGWIDSDDPSCLIAQDNEDDGYALDENGDFLYGCNDGIDNDGHGDIDGQDWYCSINGALSEESPEMSNECDDDTDNDEDGYIDSNDPDCELTGGQRELLTSAEVENYDGLDECYDGIDNDCDGLVDFDDPSCVNEAGEQDGWILSENLDGLGGICTCDDGVDNDADGWFDLEDPDCVTEQASEVGFGNTACNNNIDDDADGLIDSLDPFCFARGAETDREDIALVSTCNDSTDNDEDGYIDADDPDCEYANGVLESSEDFENSGYELPECADGIDNDSDGTIDGNDPECSIWYHNSESDGTLTEFCTDSIDNDQDGSIDCDDSDCSLDSACLVPEVCDDSVDNDGDGSVDCDDSDCASDLSCVENICDDTVDNDGDGAVDCDDSDCAADVNCVEIACDDGLDNDGDGDIDCSDTDCLTDPSCN
ncbi:MAG: IPT/TIG domain-containing protein [Myxococcota bacterium]